MNAVCGGQGMPQLDSYASGQRNKRTSYMVEADLGLIILLPQLLE